MKLDAFATERHYAGHLLPIWGALPVELRGSFHAPAAVRLALPGAPLAPGRPARVDGPVLVASYGDGRRVAPRPLVLVEHGAGQTYSGAHESYSGGRGREAVRLFLCPNEEVATRNAAAYPDARAAVVGSPWLDRWHQTDRAFKRSNIGGGSSTANVAVPDRSSIGPTVALAFHWDCRVAPESRTGWPHFVEALPRLGAWAARRGVSLLGHAHPRVWPRLSRAYASLGILAERDAAAVFERADLLVVDNSSVGWEAMSLGIPVVWLNAPWYRRDVEHGLRFWKLAGSGVQCEEPGDLIGAVERALEDPPEQRRNREAAVRRVYAYTDGRASERAVTAIMEALAAMEKLEWALHG